MSGLVLQRPLKALAVNGGPRKGWNTATLLQQALDGAASAGAETELIHLYDLDFKGCRSCYACKTRGGKSYGSCAFRDGISPVLDRLQKDDASAVDLLLLGSPLYFASLTGEMHSFLERLMYPYMTYEIPFGSLYSGHVQTALICTMGLTAEGARDRGCLDEVEGVRMRLENIFGNCDCLCSFETYQFTDYSKVVAPCFDPEARARRRAEVFPHDCRQAFEMGARLVERRRKA